MYSVKAEKKLHLNS